MSRKVEMLTSNINVKNWDERLGDNRYKPGE